MSPLLSVRDLSVSFVVEGGEVEAVRHVSFDIERGESVALVGESGSGKSVTALSIMQLLPYPKARHPSGHILLHDEELLGAPEATLRRVRGNRIAMIFQEPMTSLNPLHYHREAGERGAARAQAACPGRPRARGRSSCCGWSGCRRPSAGWTPIPTSSRAASASA